MATDNSLKKAHEEGKEAFHTVVPNARGFMDNPVNPYNINSIYGKNWQHGFNQEYLKNQRDVK